MLEEDTLNVLKFMASNGLEATPQKTAFMMLNVKNYAAMNLISIMIGNNKVVAEKKAKLLGVILDDNQKWKSQIESTINNLNIRLYLLRRLSGAISKDRIKKIRDSLFTSKISYGVQLYGKIRILILLLL